MKALKDTIKELFHLYLKIYQQMLYFSIFMNFSKNLINVKEIFEIKYVYLLNKNIN